MSTPLQLTQRVRDISVTERNAFKTCRRRWYLETIENLEPATGFAWALEFGTGIHSGLEAYYKAKGGLFDWEADPKEEMLLAFATWVDKTVEVIKEFKLGSLEDTVLGELSGYKDLGEGMLWNYHEYASLEDDFIVCAVEGQWTEEGKKLLEGAVPPYTEELHPVLHESGRYLTPIVSEDETWVDGNPYLSARLDLVVYRTATGKRGFWVYDHKTAAQAPSDSGLEFDDQVTGYGYTFWRHTGIHPRGCVYDHLIKNLPSEPRLLVKGDLSTAKDQTTLPSLYLEACKEHGLFVDGRITSEKHAECYASLCAHGWGRFFRRFETPRSPAQYKSFEQRLPVEHADMLAVSEDPTTLAYPHLSSYVCNNCSVKQICSAMEADLDYESIAETMFRQAKDRKAI